MGEINLNNASKKTMGRQKIEIAKIKIKTRLQVAFSKRRSGLFRKASELSLLCGAKIAILVQSPAGKIFSFGNPSVDSVLNNFQTGRVNFSPGFGTNNNFSSRSKYDEAMRKLDRENMIKNRMKEKVEEKGNNFWWDKSIEGLELHELEEYLEALEGLESNVLNRVANFTSWANSNSDDFHDLLEADETDNCGLSLSSSQIADDQFFEGLQIFGRMEQFY